MNLLKILDGTPEPPIIDLFLSDHNVSGDYCLSTSMLDFQKELTDQIISLHYSDILKYFETGTRTDLLIDSLQTCYLNTQLISSHPYLLINHYMPKSLVLKDIPLKLAETSGKFQTLRNLINILISFGKRDICIVLKNDKIVDLVEALLLGSKCNVKRYVGSYVKDPSKSKKYDLNVHLIPSDGNLNQRIDEAVKYDLLISFDISVDTKNEFIQRIILQNRIQKATIIRLVPVNTIEHCALFFRKKYEQGSAEYLNAVTAAIVCLRERVGVLQPDLRPIYNQNLTYLSAYFQQLFTYGETDHVPWPLPEMSVVPEFTPIDVERSLLTEVHYFTQDEDVKEDNPKKPQYYELKRLNKDYLTNPLKSSDSNLTGISIITEESFHTILTHKLMARLNIIYNEWERVDQEFAAFHSYSSSRSNGAEEVKVAMSKISDDINHINRRIGSSEKIAKKKTVESENIQSEITSVEDEMNGIIQSFSNDEKLNKWQQNQKRIFMLQESIDIELNRLKLKKKEIEYMSTEVANAASSINDSTDKIKEATSLNIDLSKRVESLFDTIDTESFKNERSASQYQIKQLTKKNSDLTSSMNERIKILQDANHKNRYGSRKGRGNSPNVK